NVERRERKCFSCVFRDQDSDEVLIGIAEVKEWDVKGSGLWINGRYRELNGILRKRRIRISPGCEDRLHRPCCAAINRTAEPELRTGSPKVKILPGTGGMKPLTQLRPPSGEWENPDRGTRVKVTSPLGSCTACTPAEVLYAATRSLPWPAMDVSLWVKNTYGRAPGNTCM